MKKLRTLFFALAILCLSVNGIYAQSTYVITGWGTSWTVVKDGTTTLATGSTIQNMIDNIRYDAAGAACTIQFGIGGSGNHLTIPQNNYITFDGNWGKITLTGGLSKEPTNSGNIMLLSGTLSTGYPINFNLEYFNGLAVNVQIKLISNESTRTINISGNITCDTGGSGSAIAVSNSSTGTININGGLIGCQSYSTAVKNYSTGTVNISGGTIYGGWTAAVENYSTGIVNISGGTLIPNGEAIFNYNEGGKITISGTAYISPDYSNGSSKNTITLTSGLLEINGGIIKNCNLTGKAIFAESGAQVNINGGIVFSYGTTDSDVINGSYTLSGNGVIAAWNKAAGNNTYFSGSSNDIYKIPATATAMWATQGGVNGISVVNNTNTGFIPIENITILPPFIPVTDITGVPTTTIKTFPLTLTGTVVPSNASNNTIVWSVQNAGTTGATITGGNILNTTNSGTATVLATIVNGASPTQNFTKTFTITVEMNPVTNITNVPPTATMNIPLTLTGTVVPSNATFQTIAWSLVYAGTTGAELISGILYTSTPGTAVVKATIINGTDIGQNYTQDFSIIVNSEFVPVTNITDVPATATAGVPLTLTGTVVPNNATNQTIVWSVKNAGTTGATITGNTLNTTGAGTAVVTATIANGGAAGANYAKDFNIVVEAPPSIDISGKVFRPNQTALSSGEVSLYRVQTMTKYILIETVQIGNDGAYLFNNVSQGGYIVKATAPPAEEMLPTYFGNSENWEQATLITVATVSISNIDITLKAAKKAPEGDSEINGTVIEDGGKRAGSPVEDVTVYLLSFENSIWTTIATTQTDDKGSFAFSKLAAGKYMTIVDAPGIKMLNSIPLDLAVTDTINILFTITDEGIETTIGNVGINSPTLPEIKVYPNPTTGELRIENGELRVKEVEIFDVVGKKVYTNHLITTSSNHLINISHLQAGVYFVRIQTEAGEVVRKVLKE